ncbi:MAG: DUF1295 domain-containing protein [Marmoricola sp.]
MSTPWLASALTAAVIAVVAVMGITATITRRTGKAAYVDAAWGASFVAAMVAAVLGVVADGGTPSWRAWLLLALVGIWGVRLSWHLGRRVRAWDHDDPRYESYLGGPISSVPFGRVLVKVFGLQALLVMVVSVPLELGAAHRSATPWVVALGVAAWLLGVIFEAVSDAQLAAYRADPDRPRILATGLWAWSRHPNYFGDFCVWWGFWLVGAAATGWRDGLVSIFSPILMSWILIGVSGVRLAEQRMQGRPGWTAYTARTPIFIPRPPVRGESII